jgi:outer membrane receptor protein involved in Fe transport
MFAGVTGTSYNTVVEGDIFRETTEPGNESEITNGFGQAAKINTIVGNLGMDFTIDERNSISLSGRFGPQRVRALVDNEIVRTVSDPLLTGNFNFSNDLSVDGVFYMPNLTWDHKFRKEGSKLQSSIFVGGFQGNLVQELSEEAMGANWQPTGVFTDRRRLDNAMDINDIRVKTDYENSFEGKGKLEMGYQYRRLLENNDMVHEDFVLPGETWVENPALSNEFQLDRSIHAVYFTWGGDLGKFSYQLGLRNEYTDRVIEQVDSSTEYLYSKFNLFPSGNITRKLKDNQQLQFSYSRRINRPGRQQLNPVEQFADNQLVVSGSPDLRPEFIDSYELAYQNQIKLGFVSVEAYYRMVNDLMTVVLTPEPGGIMHQHFVNANRSHSAGTELMANIQPAQWLRVITSGNFYYYSLEDDTFYEENDNNSFIWTANFTSVFLPTKSTRLTFSAIYNGPSITLQGTQKESYMFNVGVRQEMLKRKASLALSVRDLFKTFVIENEIRGENYLTVTSLQPETQVVTLTFTYNFNNYRQRTQEENMDLNFIR